MSQVIQCDQCLATGQMGEPWWTEVFIRSYYEGARTGHEGKMARGHKHFCSIECLSTWTDSLRETSRLTGIGQAG